MTDYTIEDLRAKMQEYKEHAAELRRTLLDCLMEGLNEPHAIKLYRDRIELAEFSADIIGSALRVHALLEYGG
jgi:hypothetical protein